MRKLVIEVVTLALAGGWVAYAHQSVVLLDTDTTTAKGPLLIDWTVSFAVCATYIARALLYCRLSSKD